MNLFGYHANETRGTREQGHVDAERVKEISAGVLRSRYQ